MLDLVGLAGVEWGMPLALLLLPVVMLVPWWVRQPRLAWSAFALSRSRRTLRQSLSWLPTLLTCAGLVCLVLALARPQLVDRQRVVEREGIDILLVLDTSGSMKADDYTVGRRRVTRLRAAKEVIGRFVEGRPDDRIGLVVFGDVAFTQVPLTTDQRAMRAFLEQVDIGMAGQSTAIGDAIAIAAQRMKALDAPERVVILLTDGDSRTGMDPKEAAKAAAALDIKVYTIGMGASGGGGGVFGGMFGQGASLDENTLKDIARITHAQYFRADDTRSLEAVYTTIDELEKTTAEVQEFVHRDERYHGVLALGLLFLVIQQLLAQTWLRRLP
jgi:Ca-activated chloride channel family protein